MKLISSSTARRRTANAALRSFGGPRCLRRLSASPRIPDDAQKFLRQVKHLQPHLQKALSCSRLTSKILRLTLSHADGHGSRSLAGRGSHEFRPNWIANIFPKNGVDCGKITFCQRPAAYLVDGRELFRTTRAPERGAHAGLIE